MNSFTVWTFQMELIFMLTEIKPFFPLILEKTAFTLQSCINIILLKNEVKQVREHYPEQWVLVEAISAYSKNSIRYLEELSDISNIPESTLACKEYKNYT
ncbi:hypothetical protein NDK43_24410 [Neobacillus pocheonensis]|uniref:Uncharacterized protein n=1 Tax=Neobacillus pocheonensis TaxID=363869 RepID=A0ABT0WF22_9BACI|nr:hypothetical protein [Neobacillus pocheonensis]